MPHTWRFSDGTEVRSDGHIKGASPFAEDLREDLAKSEPVVLHGNNSLVGLDPAWRGIRLDLQDARTVDHWLDERSEPYRMECGMRVLRRPRFQAGLWREPGEFITDVPDPETLTPDQIARAEAYRRNGGKF